MDKRFGHEKYLIRKKILTFVGGKFHIFDSEGNLVLFSKMKAFKLREDIRLFDSEEMITELITINARSVIDFSSFYDVHDATTGQKLGAYKRKGLKSMIKDEWLIFDANDNEIGSITEDSLALALIRRFIFNLIPQEYIVTINGKQVCKYKQNVNPFVSKISIEFSNDYQDIFDKRLGIAGGILLCAVEGKQH